jgi:hypothetical protein
VKIDVALKISRTERALRNAKPGEPSAIWLDEGRRGVMAIRLTVVDGSTRRYFDYDRRFLEYALPPEAYRFDDWVAHTPFDVIEALGRSL